MGDRLLTTIIELENALQEEYCREERRAAAWREREVAALERNLAATRRQLSAETLAAETPARQAAEAEAARRRQAAERLCARLTALPDVFLEAMLRRALCLLLPEDDHDHPHGQG